MLVRKEADPGVGWVGDIGSISKRPGEVERGNGDGTGIKYLCQQSEIQNVSQVFFLVSL